MKDRVDGRKLLRAQKVSKSVLVHTVETVVLINSSLAMTVPQSRCCKSSVCSSTRAPAATRVLVVQETVTRLHPVAPGIHTCPMNGT